MRIEKPADLARIVKTQRQAQQLTQQQVADEVGITRQSLARIESGQGGASFDTVLRIFAALNIRLEANPTSQQPTSAASEARMLALSKRLDRLDAGSNVVAGLLQTSGGATTPELSEASARRHALLKALIEAGDPDRVTSTPAGEQRKGSHNG